MKKKVYGVLKVALCLVLAAAVFAAGYLTSYFTNNSTLSSLKWALELIDSKYYEDIDTDSMTEIAIDAIVDAYLDQYSEYYTAAEYKALVASNAGSKTGIGVTYSYVSGSGVLVNYVMGNSPAWKSGLRAGEYLTGGSLGGEEVTFTSSYGIAEIVSSAQTGEDITLYSSDGGEYTMAKSSYTASYCYLCTNETAWTIEYSGSSYSLVESEGDKIEYLPDGCGYIKLLQFYGGAAEEFGYLLKKFYELGCDTLYLDLRSNGGGYVNVMQKISGYFVPTGSEVMRAVYKDGSYDVSYATSTGMGVSVTDDTTVYVLANSGTASASEALIGVLISYDIIDYDDIYISYYGDDYTAWLGTSAKNGKTYGKGIMQETIVNVSTGEALKLTTAKIYWPNGNCIHDVGLTADDGCTLVDASWVVTKSDEELQYVVQNPPSS